MNRVELVELLIEQSGQVATDTLFDDKGNVVWVDWGEEDVFIVNLTEQVLNTGTLSAALASDSDHLIISYEGKDRFIPLVMDNTAQHNTLLRLNEILSPDFELRMAWDSDGGDTLALIPLSMKEWEVIEQKYSPDKLAQTFLKLSQYPNIFTDTLIRP